MVLAGIATETNQIVAISGSIPTSSWQAPVSLSGPNQASASSGAGAPLSLAVGSNGAAVTAWSGGPPNGLNDRIFVSTRAAPAASWTKPLDISGSVTLGTPQSAAVNGTGQAVITFFDLGRANADQVLAATYQP